MQFAAVLKVPVVGILIVAMGCGNVFGQQVLPTTDTATIPLPDGKLDSPINLGEFRPDLLNAKDSPDGEVLFEPAAGWLLLCGVVFVGTLGVIAGCRMKQACDKMAPAITNRVNNNLMAIGGDGGGDNSFMASMSLGSCACSQDLLGGTPGILNLPGQFASDPVTGLPYAQVDLVTETTWNGASFPDLTTRIVSMSPTPMVTSATFDAQMTALGMNNPPPGGFYRVNGELVDSSQSPIVVERGTPLTIKTLTGTYGNAAHYVEEVVWFSPDLTQWVPVVRNMKPLGQRSLTSVPPLSRSGEAGFFRVSARILENVNN
jgi:hypothetical protein